MYRLGHAEVCIRLQHAGMFLGSKCPIYSLLYYSLLCTGFQLLEVSRTHGIEALRLSAFVFKSKLSICGILWFYKYYIYNKIVIIFRVTYPMNRLMRNQPTAEVVWCDHCRVPNLLSNVSVVRRKGGHHTRAKGARLGDADFLEIGAVWRETCALPATPFSK